MATLFKDMTYTVEGLVREVERGDIPLRRSSGRLSGMPQKSVICLIRWLTGSSACW